MDQQLFFTIFALMVYSGLLAYSALSYRKNADSIGSYSRGNGAYPFWFIALAMAVTMVGPADALALSQNGSKYGAIWFLFPMGAALAQMLTGLVFAKRLRTQFPDIITIGDIYEKRCGRSPRFVVGLVTVVQAIAFSGVLVLAGGQITQMFLNVDQYIGMIMTAVLVGAYTSYRGMLAVMKTDLFQGIFMGAMLLFLIVAAMIIFRSAENISKLWVKPAFDADYSPYLMAYMFLGYFLGELLLPTYCMRVAVSKDSQSASKGFVLASFILIFWYAIITFAGSIGGSIGFNSELVLVEVVQQIWANEIFWHAMAAFCFLVFLSLIHSTFDSFLNNGAVCFSRDVMGAVTALENGQQIWLAKQATVVIATFGLLLAMWKANLIDILFVGYTVWVPTMLPSLVWILLNPEKRMPTVSFWSGLIAGTAAWVVFEYVVLNVVPAILAGAILNYLAIAITTRRSHGSVPTR